MKKKRLFFFNIQNNTSANVPVSILDGFKPDTTINARTRYRWDVTSAVFSPPTFSITFTNILGGTINSNSGSAANLTQLITALNRLNIGTFWLTSSGGNIYVETYNDKIIYGDLVIGNASTFSLVYTATAPGDTVTFALSGIGTISGSIDYGDGNTQNFSVSNNLNVSHAYADAGIYTIQVYLDNAAIPTDLTVINNKVTGISGLKGLTNLVYLELNTTQVSSINLTGNTTLQELYLINGALDGLISSLDISQNTALFNIVITGHLLLTTLNTSTNAALTNILIQQCGLTSIDYSNNPLITTSALGTNNLSTSVINTLLIQLDNHGLPNGLFTSAGQVPPAPPSGAGIIAKNNLVADGWTIITDP